MRHLHGDGRGSPVSFDEWSGTGEDWGSGMCDDAFIGGGEGYGTGYAPAEGPYTTASYGSSIGALAADADVGSLL